jgi:hypothetical protein
MKKILSEIMVQIHGLYDCDLSGYTVSSKYLPYFYSAMPETKSMTNKNKI